MSASAKYPANEVERPVAKYGAADRNPEFPISNFRVSVSVNVYIKKIQIAQF